MTTTAQLLAEVPLFALLDDAEREFLASRVAIVDFQEGATMFNAGDPGASMFIVTSGTVKLYVKTKTGEELILENATAGHFFGEISLLDQGPRTATAITMTPVKAIEIGRDDLDQLCRLNPTTAMDLLAATGRRLRNNSVLLRNAATRNVNEASEDIRSPVMKTADWIADFSGSLPFLFLHLGGFAAWILFNVKLFPIGGFDAFPFALLTLIVGLEGILLSVFVLLSQNRQIARDKVRGDIEYDVNLKAEMQIGHIHEKVDLMYSELSKRLDQIQRGGPVSGIPPR